MNSSVISEGTASGGRTEGCCCELSNSLALACRDSEYYDYGHGEVQDSYEAYGMYFCGGTDYTSKSQGDCW